MIHDYDEYMPPVSVRLPAAMLAKVDALVELYNATEHGRSTRAAVMVELVTVGLLDLERRGS